MNEWCPHCGAAIYFANVDQVRMPIDAGSVMFEAVGLVAYNPKSSGGLIIEARDLGKVWGWKRLGVTLHRPHAATCPNADQHRRDAPGQLAMTDTAVAS